MFMRSLSLKPLRVQALGLVLPAALALAAPANADLITSHGISTFGELKYEAGFPHLDYVNPD
ncbi:MAG: hypothetical protein MK129_06820, partial [SAR116 cluster bacterium]|nr:hypothetical protein [SAR116 cluster bacterium]